MIYFGNFGRLKVAREQNDPLCSSAEFNWASCVLAHFFLNDSKVVKNKICFLKFLIFFKIKKNTNIKTIITFYRNQQLFTSYWKIQNFDSTEFYGGHFGRNFFTNLLTRENYLFSKKCFFLFFKKYYFRVD